MTEPAMQGLGIDRQQFATVSQRKGGHDQSSFRIKQEHQTGIRASFPGDSWESPGKGGQQYHEDTSVKGMRACSRSRNRRLLTQLGADVWYENSWHNCAGICATTTRPVPVLTDTEAAR